MNKDAVTSGLAAALRRSGLPSDPMGPAAALGAPSLDGALGGLKLGVLHEVFAQGAGDAAAAGFFAASLAARAAGAGRLFWIVQDFAGREYGAPSPLGLAELGLDPERVILIKAPDALAALRAAQEALSCAGPGAVIAEIYGAPKLLDLTASRRLALAAARTGVTGFLSHHQPSLAPSAAETRWLVKPAPSAPDEGWGWPRLAVTLARNRHGPTGEWLLDWRDGLFHDAKTPSRAVVSAPADRPAAARRSA
jgi:protein ImuA